MAPEYVLRHAVVSNRTTVKGPLYSIAIIRLEHLPSVKLNAEKFISLNGVHGNMLWNYEFPDNTFQPYTALTVSGLSILSINFMSASRMPLCLFEWTPQPSTDRLRQAQFKPRVRWGQHRLRTKTIFLHVSVASYPAYNSFFLFRYSSVCSRWLSRHFASITASEVYCLLRFRQRKD